MYVLNPFPLSPQNKTNLLCIKLLYRERTYGYEVIASVLYCYTDHFSISQYEQLTVVVLNVFQVIVLSFAFHNFCHKSTVCFNQSVIKLLYKIIQLYAKVFFML